MEVEISNDAVDCVYLSAKSKAGIDDLVNAIRQKAFTHYVRCEMLIPYDKGNVVSYFNDNATIESTLYENNGVLISMECREADYERYQQYCILGM